MKLNRNRLRRLISSEIKRLNEESDAKGVKIQQRDFDPTDSLPKNYATKLAGKKAAKAAMSQEERRELLAEQILEVGLGVKDPESDILHLMLKNYLIELLNKSNEDIREMINFAITDATKDGDLSYLNSALEKLKPN